MIVGGMLCLVSINKISYNVFNKWVEVCLVYLVSVLFVISGCLVI